MEQDQIFFLITIVLMALVTFLPRAIPLQVDADYWPKWLKNIIEYLPVAIVGAITVPALIIKDQAFTGLSAELISGIIAIATAYLSRNLIVTVVVGTSAFVILDSFFVL
ncbi:MAG: AzlD domain-containing protein [Pseudomonadota bacterium]